VVSAEAAVVGVEDVPPDPNSGQIRTVLVRLDPIAATVSSGDTVVASVRFPREAWPSPPPPPQATTAPSQASSSQAANAVPPPPPRPDPEQRLASGPYGPDVLGIRIGMPMLDAESLIRAHMHVVRVLESEPTPAGARPELHGKLFVADDRATSYFSEEIAIYEAPAPQSGKVVAAWRTLYVNDGMWDHVLQGLTAKYGAPSRDLSGPRQPVWGDGTASLCKLGGAGWNPRWIENGQPLSRRPDAMVQSPWMPPPPSASESRDRYAACGPMVAAISGGPESMADGRPLYRFTTSLLDPALMAKLSARWDSQSAAATDIRY
jgi:hypothetical protein